MADNSTRIIITAEDQASGPIGAISRNIQQLGNAVPVAQQQMSSFVSLLKGGLVGIAAGFTVDALVGNIGKTIHALAELDDMAERTGASVESLSALGRVAKISGQDMATVEQGIVRLTKALSGADEESKGAAKALKDIGLSIDDLRGKNSAEAFKAVADGLAKFEDGAGKTSVALDLFGRNGAALLPFLKDLAEEGELVGKVTAEQAAQAERYEKNMARVNSALNSFGKEMAVTVLPALADFSEQMVVGIKLTGSFWSALYEFGIKADPFTNLGDGLDKTRGRIEALQARITELKSRNGEKTSLIGGALNTGDLARSEKELGEMQRRLEMLKLLQRQNVLTVADSSNLDARDIRARTKSSALDGRTSSTGDDGSSKTARDRANEFAAEQAAAQAWAKTMGDLARITAEATDAGLGYSKAQREIVALVGSSAWGKLATETKIAALAAYDAAQAAETEADAIKATNESRKAQAALAEKIAEQRRDELDKLQAQVLEQQRHNEEIGLSTEALQDLKLARLDDVIAIEEQRAALSAMDAETEADLANIRARVAALRTLRQATAEGFQKQNATDASKAAAEAAERQWRQTSETIEKSLTDALMRGFESGKSFGENLRDTLENLFATMVLRPVIQAAVQPLAGGITNALGFGGGGSGNLLSAGNTLMNFGSSLSVGSLAAANAVGAVGGDALGTLIAGNATNWGVSAAGVGALEAGAASLGAALPWIGGAIAVGSLLMQDDGPAQRRGNFRSGLGMSTGVGPGDSNNAIDLTEWFDGSSMNASLNAFQKEMAARERRLIENLGLTAAQQNRASAALYGIGDRRYDFGMEGTDWRASSADEQIAADRLQAISDALGISIETLTEAMSDSAESIAEKAAKLKASQATDLVAAMGGTLRSLDAVTGARSGVLSAIADIKGESTFGSRSAALRELISGSSDLQAQLGYAAELKNLIVDRYRTEKTAIEANQAAAEQAAEAQRSALRDIGAYAASLFASDLSPGTAADRLAASRGGFERLLMAAQGGDAGALSGLSGAAGDYLQQARGFYASSTDYAAIFGTVQGSLAALGMTADSVTATGSWQTQMADLTSGTLDQLTDIAEMTDGWTSALETRLVEQTQEFEALGVKLDDVAANTRDLDARIASLLDAALAVRFDKLAAAVEKSAALTARAVTNAVAVTVRN